MNCKACRDEIEESEGGQPLGERSVAHLDSCPKCSAFRQEFLALTQMIGGLEVVDAPPDFDFRLRARLAASKSQDQGRVAWNRFAQSGWALALAASFVILVAIGIIVKQFYLDPSVSGGTQDIVKVKPNDGNVPKGPVSEPRSPEANAGNDVKSASLRPSSASVSQRRTSSANVNDANPRAIVSNGTATESVRSVDSSVSPATNVLPPGISDPTLTRSVFAVPVQVPTQAATITLINGSAKPQTISLRPVTFGEQDVFEETSGKRGFIPTVQGIW